MIRRRGVDSGSRERIATGINDAVEQIRCRSTLRQTAIAQCHRNTAHVGADPTGDPVLDNLGGKLRTGFVKQRPKLDRLVHGVVSLGRADGRLRRGFVQNQLPFRHHVLPIRVQSLDRKRCKGGRAGVGRVTQHIHGKNNVPCGQCRAVRKRNVLTQGKGVFHAAVGGGRHRHRGRAGVRIGGSVIVDRFAGDTVANHLTVPIGIQQPYLRQIDDHVIGFRHGKKRRVIAAEGRTADRQHLIVGGGSGRFFAAAAGKEAYAHAQQSTQCCAPPPSFHVLLPPFRRCVLMQFPSNQILPANRPPFDKYREGTLRQTAYPSRPPSKAR